MRKLINIPKKTASGYIRKRSFKMFGLWVSWILMYVPLEIYNYFITDLCILDYLSVIIHDLFLSGELGCSWPLWFIYSMAIVLLILSFFKINKRNLYVIWLFFFLLELSLYIINYINLEMEPATYWFFDRVVVRIFGGGLGITTGMLMYLYREYLQVFMIPVFLSISVVLFYSEWPYYSLIGGAALFIAGLIIKLRPHPFYRFIRNVSMWTYYIHMYVIYCVIWSIRLSILPFHFPLNYLTVGSLVLLVACCLGLIQRVKGFKWIGFLIT